jgi:predicted SAM-dependent methyltransferase
MKGRGRFIIREKALMITRLQLGTSRLERLDPRTWPAFLNPSWMHFGDDADSKPRTLSYLLNEFTIPQMIGVAYQKLSQRRSPAINAEDLYSRTNFRPWIFSKGDALPFDDSTLHFIYSEHFLEHLFFDEAVSLLRECHRVLKPSGVIRTVVPDADLRTYLPPEPVGYPKRDLPFTHPKKHKTRWSVYLLSEALALTGFEAIPLHYCDREGTLITRKPAELKETYEDCPDLEIVLDLGYIMKRESLIVDGIKR